METSDKPFTCDVRDCGQGFTNEDHLMVHKQKHQMTLAVGNKNLNTIAFTADQTPTPTRFLRGSEEGTLFSDLPVNPFEESFRKAAAANASGQHHLLSGHHEKMLLVSVNPSDHSDTLNTPALIPLEHAIVGTSVGNTPDILTPPVITVTESVKKEQNDCSKTELRTIKPTPASPSVILHPGITRLSPFNMIATSQPTFIRLPSQLSPTILETSGDGVTKPVSPKPIKPHPSKENDQVKTIAAAPLQLDVNPVQLYLKLPDGSAVPCMQVPTGVIETQAIHTQVETTKVATTATVSSTTGNMSLAKLKLKAALTQGNQEAGSSSTIKSNDISAQTPSPRVSEGQQIVTTTQPVSNRKRRASEDDPDEKRRKILERNRAAATRCRVKRKMWISALETKVDELSHSNQALQKEVNKLRKEIASLKSLLLLHRYCPVTLAQLSANEQQNTSAKNDTAVLHQTLNADKSDSSITDAEDVPPTNDPKTCRDDDDEVTIIDARTGVTVGKERLITTSESQPQDRESLPGVDTVASPEQNLHTLAETMIEQAGSSAEMEKSGTCEGNSYSRYRS